MSAPCAEVTTMPKPVNLHVFKTRTPLLPQAWWQALQHLHLLNEFSDIPIGIANGFHTGVNSIISRTFIPHNHSSALRNPAIIISHIQTELALKCYSGPYFPAQLQKIIGNFRTAPLGAVPKPNSVKFRVIQDLSFPRNDPTLPSVNSEIDSDLFLCEWSTFAQCCFVLAKAPPGTQAAVFDVDSAYRIIPITPEDQRHFCVMWDNLIYIDHCAAFGSALSCGLFGRVADAFVAIIKNLSVDQVLKWVDDIIIVCYPYPSSTASPFRFQASLIFNIAQYLGWPWSIPKFQDFDSSFTYLGFLWDFNNRSVTLTEAKQQKFLQRLLPWLTAQKMDIRNAQKLHGLLNHCCFVLPLGRSKLHYLNLFIAHLSRAKSPFVKWTIPRTLCAKLHWWKAILSGTPISRSVQLPPDISSAQVFVDASTSWGIGVLIDSKWAAWQYTSDVFSNNIGWAEMLAVEFAISYLTRLYPKKSHFRIHSDNQGVLGAIQHGSLRGTLQNASLSRFSALLLNNDNFVSAQYVHTKANPADPISRGLFPSHKSHLAFPIIIDPSLVPHLRYVP